MYKFDILFLIKVKRYLKTSIVSYFIGLVLLGAVFVINSVLGAEGYNPSDEGAVIAQSYRILKGEIPHLDFISMRPIFSGLFHIIDLLIPAPLIISSRWITFVEIYTFYFVLFLLLSKLLVIKNGNLKVMFITLILAPLSMELFLFPWTTIDALFFSSLSLFFISKLYCNDEKWYFVSLAVLFASFASLCRQTFFLYFLFVIVILIIKMTLQAKFKQYLISIIIGSIPFFLYLTLLVINNCFQDALMQLFARGEFYERGIFVYKLFLMSPGIYAFKVILLIGIVIFILLLFLPRLKLILFRWFYLLMTFIFFYCFVKILFLDSKELISEYSFNIFFSFLIFSVFCIKISNSIKGFLPVYLFVLILISWISSISVGLPYPYFMVGVLLGVAIIICFHGLNFCLYSFEKTSLYSRSFKFALFVFLIWYCFNSSKRIGRLNYRDKPAEYLIHDLSLIHYNYTGIKTNTNTYNYLKELNNLTLNYHNKFITIPNNSMIYALTNSRNPLPVDWFQEPEFRGSNHKLLCALRKLNERSDYVFILDKVDSKEIAD